MTNATIPLRIGVNALHMAWGVNAGTETYLSNIVRPWYELRPLGAHFTLFCQSAPDWWRGDREHFKLLEIVAGRGLLGRFVYEQLILPFSAFKELDVVFHPGYVGSWLASVKQVITIHDAFAWVCPQEIPKAKSIYWRIFIPAAAKRAVRIIADTHVTAMDVAKFCRIPPGKIQVVHLAGGHLESLTPDLGVLATNGLSAGEYFHCVGIFKDIKNPWRVLSAYQRYRDLCGSLPPKKLVLLGHVGDKAAIKIREAAAAVSGVLIGGRVSDSELAALYLHSAGLIFPSLYEGFGLPILEAQRLGCPVVTSNLSCMPEVAGKGAILVDPADVEDIARAFVALGRARPQELIGLGRENAKLFSWGVASEATLKALGDVCNLGAHF